MMKFKRLAAVCSALLMALLCACSVPADSDSAPVSQQKAKDGELAVHFLDVGQGDSEFIELPGGETMLIDAGEQEYGKTVSDYISSLGYSEITYLVATHPHSDHIGGFDTVIDADKVVVQKAFLKPYDESGINLFERTQWDNKEVYMQMHDALIRKNVPICTAFDGDSFQMGDMKITFFNGASVHRFRKTGENENSVVTLVECGGCRALLAGDMNWKCGGEKKIAKAVGKIDLLKVGHHGYEFSSSAFWLKTLDPDIAVILNSENRVHKSVAARIKKYSGAKTYTSADLNGLKAVFENGTIRMETNIM